MQNVLRVRYMWYLTHNALYDFPPKFNMAANRASTIEEWENFFEELLHLMTDYEAFYDSTDLRLRESIVIRMEPALLALQQVITGLCFGSTRNRKKKRNVHTM